MTITDSAPPMILTPGYWLGGWAWDEVADRLAKVGIPTVGITLPGLESASTPRADIRFADHVGALLAAMHDSPRPVVLVAHSGAGAVTAAALDAAPELVRRVVYVDSGPASDGTIPRPDLSPDTVEVPLPPFPELEAAGSSLAGLSEHLLQRFRERAVPQPAGPLLEPIRLHNPARTLVPATIVCCSISGETIRRLAADGEPMFAPLNEFRDLTYVDLPTGHWPMWSAPDELATILAEANHG
jgi:pimeloyl-ACP methyl ester carboxylesterase